MDDLRGDESPLQRNCASKFIEGLQLLNKDCTFEFDWNRRTFRTFPNKKRKKLLSHDFPYLLFLRVTRYSIIPYLAINLIYLVAWFIWIYSRLPDSPQYLQVLVIISFVILMLAVSTNVIEYYVVENAESPLAKLTHYMDIFRAVTIAIVCHTLEVNLHVSPMIFIIIYQTTSQFLRQKYFESFLLGYLYCFTGKIMNDNIPILWYFVLCNICFLVLSYGLSLQIHHMIMQIISHSLSLFILKKESQRCEDSKTHFTNVIFSNSTIKHNKGDKNVDGTSRMNPSEIASVDNKGNDDKEVDDNDDEDRDGNDDDIVVGGDDDNGVDEVDKDLEVHDILDETSSFHDSIKQKPGKPVRIFDRINLLFSRMNPFRDKDESNSLSLQQKCSMHGITLHDSVKPDILRQLNKNSAISHAFYGVVAINLDSSGAAGQENYLNYMRLNATKDVIMNIAKRHNIQYIQQVGKIWVGFTGGDKTQKRATQDCCNCVEMGITVAQLSYEYKWHVTTAIEYGFIMGSKLDLFGADIRRVLTCAHFSKTSGLFISESVKKHAVKTKSHELHRSLISQIQFHNIPRCSEKTWKPPSVFFGVYYAEN